MDKPQNPIEEMMNSTIAKLKTMVDSSTIIGAPIESEKGVLILPVSKVSVGFVAGGGEYSAKRKKTKKQYPFAGGGSAGVSLTPVGFLCVCGGIVNFIKATDRTPLDKVLENLPELIKKFSSKNGGQKSAKTK